MLEIEKLLRALPWNCPREERAGLLERLRELDPQHAAVCGLHNSSEPELSGCALGYSKNSRGDYSTWAPSCSCRIGPDA